MDAAPLPPRAGPGTARPPRAAAGVPSGGFLGGRLGKVVPRSLAGWFAVCWGLFLVAALVAGLLFVDTAGAGAFAGLTITANILMSLAIDHFGLFRMEVHQLNLWRVLGGALMAAGVALVTAF